MSQGALDRGRFEAIEAYVLGTMSAEERVRFEQEMNSDAALRAEVELQRENIHAVELGGLTRILKKAGVEQAKGEQNGTGSGAWKQRLKYAAVIAIILSGSLWLLRPSANERLFAAHFVVDPGFPVTMGSTDDPAFADAMVSYKEGNYAEARAKWATLRQQEPANDTLRYYIATAWFAEGHTETAIPMFDALANEPNSVFNARARWFLFLAYVRVGDLAHARSVDFSGDARRAQEAATMLTELER